MGLLSEGEPLEWEEMKEWQTHVRKYGVEQFIRLYNKLKVKTARFPDDMRRMTTMDDGDLLCFRTTLGAG